MVLQDASTSTVNDSFEDSAPETDSDPYAGDNGRASNYRIDPSRLPKPIPIIGPLIGYNEALLSKLVTNKIAHASQLLHRPMTQEEVDALAFWSAKQISIVSYGAPIGVAGGLWRCYTTADSFRVPFYKPNLETFNAYEFPRWVTLLRGQKAVVAWHAVRALAYGGVGNIIGSLFFGSYSMTVAAVGELSDKRLKPFVDAARTEGNKARGSLTGASGQRGMGQQQQRGGIGPASNHQGDANRADSTELAWDISSTQVDESQDGPTDGLRASPQAQPAPAQTTPRPRWPQAKPVPVQAQAEDNSAQPFGIFDDASPTGGQGVQADIRAAPTSQGGSAWDRIRKGEKPTPRGPATSIQQQPSQSAWQQRQREGSTTGDSFAFSKSEEERSLAKEEAQKVFDARVERESRGGDFSQGSGDEKRW